MQSGMQEEDSQKENKQNNESIQQYQTLFSSQSFLFETTPIMCLSYYFITLSSPFPSQFSCFRFHSHSIFV